MKSIGALPSLFAAAIVSISPFQAMDAFAATDSRLPKIIVILTDDQGYADISHNPRHSKEVSTPHMDALAAEGVSFTQAYTNGHVCSPTRAALMLGQYQQRVGIYTAGDGGQGFDPKRKIFPGFLPQAYRSMAIGKWHLGLDNDYPELKWHAMSRGFHEAFKFMGRGGHDYFESKGVNGDDYQPIYENKRRIPADEYEGYLTTRFSQEAVDFIDRQKNAPFFLYLAYNAVHTPAQAPQEDIDYFKTKHPHLSDRRATLLAMLRHLDDGIGDVVEKLKEEGIWKNTLLFFLTDNGGASAMEADNGLLRDFKQSLYEGGIRTPFIVTWPDRFEGGQTIDTPIMSFDILPTVLEATKSKAPEAKDFDGKSLLPLLEGKAKEHHETLYWDAGDARRGWAVRQGDWKLKGTQKGFELFNLAKDPSEKNDISQTHPEIVANLEKLYKNWIAPMPESLSKARRKR